NWPAELGWPFSFCFRGLEQYSDRHRNEARGSAAGVDAVVARFDESLETRAERNLDPPADIPAEVVLRAGAPTTVEPCAGAIETDAADRVRGKRHAQRQFVREVPRE